MKPVHLVSTAAVLAAAIGSAPATIAQESPPPEASSQAAEASETPTPEPDPLEVLTALRERLTEMFEDFRASSGDERRLGWERLIRTGRPFGAILQPLVDELAAALDAGTVDEERLAVVRGHVEWAQNMLGEQIIANDELIDQAVGDRQAVAVEDLLAFEQDLGREIAINDQLILAYVTNARRMRTLQMPTEAMQQAVRERLIEATDEFGGRIELSLTQGAELETQLAAAIQEQRPAIETRQRALAERLHNLTTSLQTLTTMMEAHGLNTASHKQLLIRATGTVTPAIFDPEVAAGLLDTATRKANEWLQENGAFIVSRTVLFLVIVVFFRIIAWFVNRVTARLIAASASRFPPLLRKTAASIAGNTVMLIGLLVALSHVGIEVGPMLASLGVAGFILGFALQDSLSNFAAGAMILFYSPFDVGDVVEAGGVKGKVRQLSLVSTTILTFDNQRLIVPNRKIWGDVIRNVTAEELRRIDFTFTVATTDDVERAMALLSEIVAAHELILEEPAATVRLNDMQDGQASIVVRPWVKTGDYWGVRWDIMETVRQRFDAEGFTIAPPRREIVIRPEK